MKNVDVRSHQDVLRYAREHIEEQKKDESVHLKCAFANAVQTAVTGVAGGYGGPSIREHAACRVLQEASLEEALQEFGKKDGVIFGPLTNLHQQLAQYEHCFDDDQWDVLVLSLNRGVPTKIMVETGDKPEDYHEIWVWGSVFHHMTPTIMYNEAADEPIDAMLLEDFAISVTSSNEELNAEVCKKIQELGWEISEEISSIFAFEKDQNFSKQGNGEVIPFEELAAALWAIRNVFISQYGVANVRVVK